MRYQECRPSRELRHFIKCYWFLEDDRPTRDVQRIFPDGRSELVLNFAKPFESFSNGGWHLQPQFFVVGQITGPLLVRPGGLTRTFGVRFHPHGAAQLLRVPIHEITDSIVPLPDITKLLSRELESIVDSDSLPMQFASLDRALLAHLHQAAADDIVVRFVAAQFERSGGLTAIGSIAAGVGISTRQLERRFRTLVGVSPKLFCRMQRFQNIFRGMGSDDTNWAEAAVRCGYYDQAHLIRDFREFAGTTPAALLADEVDLARYFLSSEAVSHFSKTPSNGRS